ncbi:hypothetical protein C2869_01095 [Saccharobesus litoralis]|uniref:Uncharacterized protein n=1 Tax=Saccharobesus litoralis TaxID=2172099 RepID=A0A2S0VLP0_9ALTE|nr:hypothetical protein [Saccharobesus litoralis]AWB65122.1 hypothetical protein C2869_01095 [Saccharobesus litoralis]
MSLKSTKSLVLSALALMSMSSMAATQSYSLSAYVNESKVESHTLSIPAGTPVTVTITSQCVASTHVDLHPNRSSD